MIQREYALADYAFICFEGRHCVVLDVRHDNYICIPRAEVELLGPWLRGWSGRPQMQSKEMPPDAAGHVQELLAAEILVSASARSKDFAPCAIKPATAAIALAERVPVAALLGRALPFVAAARAAHKALTRMKLEQTVEAVRRRNDAGRAIGRKEDLQTLTDLVSTFYLLRPFFNRDYLCLFDSLSLMNFLARFGFFPSWTFGVQSEPFAAHCWVQHGELLLNDSVDEVLPYTPIMAI